MAIAQRRSGRKAIPLRGERILEVGRRIFAEKGFAKTSVDEIAEAAGIAKGTVYLYHPSKEALYFATLRSGLADLSRVAQSRMKVAPTLKGKLQALFRTKLEYFDLHRDFFRIYEAEFGGVTQPVIRKDLRALFLGHVRLLEAEIEAAARRGEIRRVSAETAAFVLADVTRGLIGRRLMGSSRSRVEDDVDFLVDFVWKGLSGR